MIQQERIKHLNHRPARRGEFVLYWMQASQRVEYNHALEYAIRRANELGQPLVVFFGVTDAFPEANERHYHFMIEGLSEIRRELEKRGIAMTVQRVSPEAGVVRIAKRASLVIADRGYLRIQRAWRRHAAAHCPCSVVQVESDAIVPVEEASGKEEYAAATIRPKIHRVLEDYLVPVLRTAPRADSLGLRFKSIDIEDVPAAVGRLSIDRSVGRSSFYRGGTSEAKRLLRTFIEKKLDRFDTLRNDPGCDNLSHMSPYLHFGQISPLFIALEVMEAKSPGGPAFIEELVVRRELAINFIYYNGRYDSYVGLPEWCRKTLREHENDERPYVYSVRRLEEAATHDPYWNAAQTEMVLTGKMHGYMRMYWGKKILEWRKRPRDAFRTALYLNNKYEIDGRDPNGFTGVAWCFGKHDRPWGERDVFGKVRYMNDRGLRRKFDVDGYVRRIDNLKSGVEGEVQEVKSRADLETR
jgi:deoxyribodipyrimidine photo-lyase